MVLAIPRNIYWYWLIDDHDFAILLQHQPAAINKVHVVINHCAVRKTFVRSLRSGVYKACCSIGVPSVHLPPNTLNPKQTMHSLLVVFLVLFSTSSWTEAQSQNKVTFENCSSASLRACVDDYCVAICDDDGRQVLQAMLYSFKGIVHQFFSIIQISYFG